MTTPFSVYGPYSIDRKHAPSKQWQKIAWREVDEKVGADLSNAKGVYVYSLRHGKKITPLYVGITNRGFRNEVFAVHNLQKISYNWRDEKGTIVLHLLAKPKGVHTGFSRNLAKGLLETLEVLLIFMCRRSNKKLLNKKNIKWLDDAGIRGITGTEKQRGQPTLPIQTFKRVLNW